MKEYNKLVRDRIPEIMINKGCKPVTRILNDEDYRSGNYNIEFIAEKEEAILNNEII